MEWLQYWGYPLVRTYRPRREEDIEQGHTGGLFRPEVASHGLLHVGSQGTRLPMLPDGL